MRSWVINRVYCGLMTILLLSGGLYPGYAVFQSEDTNGDRHVDVLDLQVVIASVLGSAPADARADVNQDGRVDILDFQKILDAAGKLADSQDGQDPSQAPKGTMPLRIDAPLFVAERCPLECCLIETHLLKSLIGPDSQNHAARTAQRMRYVCRLTPHAPPCLS